MYQRDFTPPNWALNTLLVRLELVDENGNPTEPQLSNSVVAETECSGEGLVTLQVINAAEANVAPATGLCFSATDSPGVYLSEIRGLNPGNYVIVASIDPTQAVLSTLDQEYQMPELLDATSGQYILQAPLSVQVHPLIWWQIGVSSGVVALIVVLVVILVIRHRLYSANPLQGTIGIYMVQPQADDDSLLQPLWEQKWPPTHTYPFESSEFIGDPALTVLNIVKIQGTTKGNPEDSRNKRVHLSVEAAGRGDLAGRVISPDEAFVIDQQRGNVYYIVATPSHPVTVARLKAMVR
jgi:hypothetical protein